MSRVWRVHAVLAHALLFALLLVGSAAARAQPAQVVDLPTRPGVQQRMLVLQPEKVDSVVVLMTGGAGRLHVFDNGSLGNDGNFLVRSRSLFAQHGHAVVLLDTPSDHGSHPFLRGGFRESAEHATDMGAAIEWARRRFGKPVYVVGTSRGTHSAANAGVRLTGAAAPDGIVLTSSILSRGRFGPADARPIQEMGVGGLAMPVLVVHHEEDPCGVCPPEALPALVAALPASRTRVLTYKGGRSVGPACDPFSHHGFNGIEDRVIADISAWIAGAGK